MAIKVTQRGSTVRKKKPGFKWRGNLIEGNKRERSTVKKMLEFIHISIYSSKSSFEMIPNSIQ